MRYGVLCTVYSRRGGTQSVSAFCCYHGVFHEKATVRQRAFGVQLCLREFTRHDSVVVLSAHSHIYVLCPLTLSLFLGSAAMESLSNLTQFLVNWKKPLQYFHIPKGPCSKSSFVGVLCWDWRNFVDRCWHVLLRECFLINCFQTCKYRQQVLPNSWSFGLLLLLLLLLLLTLQPGMGLGLFNNLLHSCLSLTFTLQSVIFIRFRSSTTWSIHLNLGLPTGLVLYGVHSVIFLVGLVFSILITWAAHLSLCGFVNFTMSSCLILCLSSSLVLILRDPSSVCLILQNITPRSNYVHRDTGQCWHELLDLVL